MLFSTNCLNCFKNISQVLVGERRSNVLQNIFLRCLTIVLCELLKLNSTSEAFLWDLTWGFQDPTLGTSQPHSGVQSSKPINYIFSKV